jgi:hypothetical protein
VGRRCRPGDLSELGVEGVVPCESTIRRTLQSLDADALDERLGTWASAHQPAAGPAAGRGGRQDGARLSHRRPAGRHLLAAFDRAAGVLLGQVDVAAKTNEIPMFTTLLDRIDLADAIVTPTSLLCAFPMPPPIASHLWSKWRCCDRFLVRGPSRT